MHCYAMDQDLAQRNHAAQALVKLRTESAKIATLAMLPVTKTLSREEQAINTLSRFESKRLAQEKILLAKKKQPLKEKTQLN